MDIYEATKDLDLDLDRHLQGKINHLMPQYKIREIYFLMDAPFISLSSLYCDKSQLL